jgi:diaminohydroxyphosphoribosylaminopyrimidine deaminase/5-amino-6-(5-phosphoribosylamino)uracil reductase
VSAAKRLNRGFFLRHAEQRPLFAFKTATGLDGRIAMASGESKWITGAQARQAVQALRARYDAIMVGSETAVADDPELTCRMDGYDGRPKIRIVVDRRLRLSPKSKLAQTAKAIPTWVMTANEAVSQGQRLTDLGVNIIPVDEDDDNRAFITNTAAILARMGLTRVLVEGGGRLAASLFDAGLMDEVAWFRAAKVMGGNCRPAVAALAGDRLADAPGFNHILSLTLGADQFDMYERA